MTNYILTENADNFPGANDNSGADSISALGGDDTVAAGGGNDTVNGGAGNDLILGGAGADSLYGGTGNDTLEGGAGADYINGDGTVSYTGLDTVTYVHSTAAVTINQLTGTHTGDAAGDTYVDISVWELTNFDDVIVGGRAFGLDGNDTLTAGNSYIGVVFDGGEGDDSVAGFSGADFLTGGNGDDTLTGGANADDLFAGAGADELSAGAGIDELWGDEGADTLSGGDDFDVLEGGFGADELSGGAGADRFVIDRRADSTAAATDLISDLANEDRIRLTRIDADTNTVGNQAFHLVAALTGAAGELTLSYDAGQNITYLLGEVNGRGGADLVVAIAGDHTDFTNFAL